MKKKKVLRLVSAGVCVTSLVLALAIPQAMKGLGIVAVAGILGFLISFTEIEGVTA